MAISPARVAAFDILLRVEREDSYASELLHPLRYSDLTSADHGLATVLAMGVVRWRLFLLPIAVSRSGARARGRA
jgi:16S rRNA (cytosine967-C5)-methyltransferase